MRSCYPSPRTACAERDPRRESMKMPRTCRLLPVALIATLPVLPGSRAVADAIYTVTDLGPSPAGRQAGGGYIPADVITENRLSIDAAGKVTSAPWPEPGTYTGPLPDTLAHGAYGPSAVALASA